MWFCSRLLNEVCPCTVEWKEYNAIQNWHGAHNQNPNFQENLMETSEFYRKLITSPYVRPKLLHIFSCYVCDVFHSGPAKKIERDDTYFSFQKPLFWLNGQFSFDEWKVMKGNLWLVPAVKCPTISSLNWKWFKIMGGGRVGSHPEINNIQIEKKYPKYAKPARMMRTLPLPPFIYFTKKPNFSTQTLEDFSVWYLLSNSRLIFFQNLVLKNGR